MLQHIRIYIPVTVTFDPWHLTFWPHFWRTALWPWHVALTVSRRSMTYRISVD